MQGVCGSEQAGMKAANDTLNLLPPGVVVSGASTTKIKKNMNNEMLSQKGKRTEKPSALGGLGTSIRRKWKEECMNHGRGERTDHLPIFDKTMPDRI